MVVPTMRTVIADDECLSRKKLLILLSSEEGINVAAECLDGKQAVEAVRLHKPDLLFLDIEMPDLNGFEVLEQISKEHLPVVIFTTAYDHYAIRAFEAHALDYLLKPFNQARLHHSLERARAELLKSHEQNVQARLRDMSRSTRAQSKRSTRLRIKASGRGVFLC